MIDVHVFYSIGVHHCTVQPAMAVPEAVDSLISAGATADILNIVS